VALDGTADLSAYLQGEPLAMALVDAVPVGQYGKAALQSIGQWAGVEPFVVQVEDARAALALVSTGQAGFGVVYATDALALIAAGQGVEVGRFPETSHDPIRYPAAVVAGAAKPAAAEAFLAFLQGPEAQAIFAERGYRILPQ
jgi:molybdate transport system substrate-binding protein